MAPPPASDDRTEVSDMDIDDLVNKAKGALSNVSDDQIEDVAEKVKDKTPDNVVGIVDTAADFLKGQND